MRKIERELRKAWPQAAIEPVGGHYRLRLPNGRRVTTSGTPSHPNWINKVAADVRRAMRSGAEDP